MTEATKIPFLSRPSLDVEIPRNLSFPLVNEDNYTLLKNNGGKKKPGLLRGPRRVLRLCVFGVIFPSMLIAIPLYVRLVLYPPEVYPMMPTDQRLLNRHVSGFWCQAQSTKMNGSFNAFLSHGSPGLGQERRRHVMLHSMKMRDDVKEYWGFHFLKGSSVTISTCSRWDGAQMMILRGIENLRRCAWIGQRDSFEDFAEDDELSSIEQNALEKQRFLEANNPNKAKDSSIATDLKNGVNSEERRQGLSDLIREAVKMSKDKTEILKILHVVSKKNKLNSKSKDNPDMDVHNNTETSSDSDNAHNVKNTPLLLHKSKTKKNIKMNNEEEEEFSSGLVPEELIVDAEISKRLKDSLKKSKRRNSKRQNRKKNKGERRRIENLTEEDLTEFDHKVQRRARKAKILKRSVNYDDVDGAFEELDTEDNLNIFEDPEKENRDFDKTNRPINKDDTTFGRHTAESLIGGNVFFPEGLKFERGRFNQTNIYDNSNEEHVSSYSSSEEALASCEGVIMTLPLVPFRGCNFDNMGLNRITYDIPATGTYYFVFNSDNELYANHLYFNLTMNRVVYNTNSSEQICSETSNCTLPLGLWSDDQTVVEVPQERQWDHSYVLETKCEPRVYVYLSLLLLVPLFIMCCALR